jgi:hypothetical protein
MDSGHVTCRVDRLAEQAMLTYCVGWVTLQPDPLALPVCCSCLHHLCPTASSPEQQSQGHGCCSPEVGIDKELHALILPGLLTAYLQDPHQKTEGLLAQLPTPTCSGPPAVRLHIWQLSASPQAAYVSLCNKELCASRWHGHVLLHWLHPTDEVILLT